jgi:hypothetical protein
MTPSLLRDEAIFGWFFRYGDRNPGGFAAIATLRIHA